MEAIHRDHNFLSEFIHVQEAADNFGEYEHTMLERLEAAIWDQLDKEDQTAFDGHMKGLTELITNALTSLERTAKTAL